MSQRADPTLLNELKHYGAVGIEKCFNCGTCTARCPLASDAHPFPRSMVRRAQLGQRERLKEQLDPWLCYYCGDCSDTCPKGAEPGETMMALRRWLTAQYDTSGHSARLYRSEKAVYLSILKGSLFNLIVLALFYLLGIARLDTSRVALNTAFPVMWIWAVVLIHFAYLGAKVLRNMLNMARLVLRGEGSPQVSWATYIASFKSFVVHFLTQQRWRVCGGESKSAWLKHILFMSGYVTMLVLIIPMLWWFQTDNLYPIYHPQRWLGYYATIMLIVFSVDFLLGRRRRQAQRQRFSHPSDWLFPAFVLIGAATGILIHIFRYLGASAPVWAWPTYIIYAVHLLAMFAMLDTEVGIGKWMHMMYRPLAAYLETVLEKVRQERAVPEGAVAVAD